MSTRVLAFPTQAAATRRTRRRGAARTTSTLTHDEAVSAQLNRHIHIANSVGGEHVEFRGYAVAEPTAEDSPILRLEVPRAIFGLDDGLSRKVMDLLKSLLIADGVTPELAPAPRPHLEVVR